MYWAKYRAILEENLEAAKDLRLGLRFRTMFLNIQQKLKWNGLDERMFMWDRMASPNSSWTVVAEFEKQCLQMLSIQADWTEPISKYK